MRASFIIAFSVLFVEEVLGIHLFGENAWTTDGHEVNPGHMNAADNNMILPGAEGGVLLSLDNSIYNFKTNLTQKTGDEHIKHYYGVNIFNQRYAGETSQTKGQ